MEKSRVLRNLLNAYWLRPETALWRTIDIETMKDFEFKSPSLDLGCGDGTFSFLRAGGEFADSFDVFLQVDNLDMFYDKADIYDSFQNNVSPTIVTKPKYQIDYAFDHKENLLKKAKELDLHKQFVVGDANKKLPFEDESFNSIFSNIIYWLDEPSKVFGEIYRVLKPGGQCCIMLPNESYTDFSFYNSLYVKQGIEMFKFLEMIDRGRVTDNIKQAKSSEEWEKLILGSGLKIVSHKRHLSKTTIQLWDIGLRPIFPFLKRMSQNINPNILLEIKKDWVEFFEEIANPLVENDSLLNQDVEPAFHCFILEK